MVAPKRHLLPLVILSLSAFFFYSYYHSSLSSSTPKPMSYFNLNDRFDLQNSNSNSPNFTFIIKVLAFNRLDSLSRCLRSLDSADYLGDRVSLHIYIDHFAYEIGSSGLDNELNESHRILEFVDGFKWKYGEKLVHYRTGNVGLQAQWLEAWWPSSDNEFAFIVEDDLEVSSLYYEFVKALIFNIYYNDTNYSPSIYGASLQRPRFVPGKHGNKIKLDSQTRLFLYQLVGTWGQVLFPKPWKEFRLWYDKHKVEGIKPVLEGMVTTGWYKRMGEKIWTPWFVKFVHSRGYFNIYTNFLHERALSVSHRDAGVNYGKTAGPDSQLLDDSSLDFNILEMQPLSHLRWYDFCFREVVPNRVIGNLDELLSLLYSMQKQGTIILVSIFGVSETVTRNLLCHFESLNIWNFILMGPESGFLFDLARRGHPVINVDQFVKNVRPHKSLLQDYSGEPVKEIFVKAYVIKKCIEHRYNTWVVDGNMAFINSDLFAKPMDQSHDLYAAKSLELFHARSSSSTEKLWDDAFMSTFVATVDSLVRKVPSSRNVLSFGNMVTSLFEHKGVHVERLDETLIGLEIGIGTVNKSDLNHKKMAYWSAEMELDSIQEQLVNLNLWVIDKDFACKAVVCHKS